MVSFRGRGQAADGGLRRDWRPRSPERGGGGAGAMPLGPEGRWQPELWGGRSRQPSCGQGAASGILCPPSGAGPQSGEKAPAVDGFITHNPSLFGSLPGHALTAAPATPASRLSVCCPEEQRGVPGPRSEPEPFSWHHLEPAPSTQPFSRGQQREGQPLSLCAFPAHGSCSQRWKEPVSPLGWWRVGKAGQRRLLRGCGQGGMWAELSVEASSGSSCSWP